MLHHTLEMAQVNGVCHAITLTAASLERLPYSGPFDAVFAGALLHHIENLDRAMLEIRRVLKIGGVFVAYEPLAMPLWDIGRETLPYQGCSVLR
jgi:ubiquinone/menaquinone biosynthesis C-methylase UbiE